MTTVYPDWEIAKKLLDAAFAPKNNTVTRIHERRVFLRPIGDAEPQKVICAPFSGVQAAVPLTVDQLALSTNWARMIRKVINEPGFRSAA